MKHYIVITGVAGLLGSRMADWIIKNHPEFQVIGIDNLQGGYMENVNKDVLFYKYDISETALDSLFERYSANNNQIDYVFHFAAYAAEGLSPFIRKFNWRSNALSTAEIINCCIKYNIKRLVYTSSMSVYGPGIEGERFTEDLQPNPQDPYAISKYACEMDIQSAEKTHGLDWCILRPHNVYGRNQNIWDRYRNVLGIWMYQKLTKKPLTIYGDGEQTRAFSYIDDCLEPMWNAAVRDCASKQIINIGGINDHSINEAMDVMLNVIGKSEVVHLEERYEIKHAVPSFEKSIELLGYKEHVDLYNGLKDMWNWALVQPKRKQQTWDSYELEKGLYSYWKN